MLILTTSRAIKALLPGTEWWMQNEDLTTLIIYTPDIIAPTQDQVNTWIANNP